MKIANIRPCYSSSTSSNFSNTLNVLVSLLYFGVHKPILIISALVLFSILAVAVLSAFWPRYEERFIELGLLGKDKKAEGYYPNDNSTLKVGSPILWHIYVHNHVGSIQNVSVRVKLLNSTMEMPNDQEHKPSPYAFFIEFPLSLPVDETLIVPFSWSILDTASQNDSIIIKSLIVNNQTVQVNVPASTDNSFRMVFELWVYDRSTHEYKFGWSSGKEFYSASTYIWFRITLPSD
jgi:hypothetical protein